MGFRPYGSFSGGLPNQSTRFRKIYIDSAELSRELLLMDKAVIRSVNFEEGTAGFILRYDGSVELNDVVIRGDLVSSNWDGADPANLATVDGAATTGFYLDSSVGAAQFEGSIYLGGNLEMTAAGYIVTDASAPRLRIGGDKPDRIELFTGAGDEKEQAYIRTFASGGTPYFAIQGPESTTQAAVGTGWTGAAGLTLLMHQAALKSGSYGGATAQIGVGDLLNNGVLGAWTSHYFAVGVTSLGNSAAPDFTFWGDLDTGMYRYGADQIGFSTGGSARVVIDSNGITVASGIFIAGSVGANDYMQISEGSDYARFVLDNSEYFRVNKGTLQAHDGTSGLVEIFPKTYIAAGSVQTASITLTTTETEYGSQTIACEYASQPVLVSVQVTMRVVKSDNLVYTWLRAGINGTAKGSQVPLIDSATGSSRYQMISTEWTEEVTANGSGNVTVGAFAKVESGTAGSTVVQVTYRVERR